MRPYHLTLFTLLLFSIITVYGQSSNKVCGNQQVYESLENNSRYQHIQSLLEGKANRFSFQKSDTVITIPVVVHVVYKNGFENISDAQIYSQLDVLNRDFRKLNPDTSIVKPGFSVADVKLEFCLAHTDPNGNFTTGITRTATTEDNIGLSERYFIIKPTWGNEYLNIWVCDFGSNVAGQGYPPGSPADRDGIVIDYTNFGTLGSVIAPYDKGRTTTHEIGHFLNLFHIWGQNDLNPNCSSDDLVADTPSQSVVYSGCPSIGSSCLSADMLSNYMGYVFDNCMANYTLGQKTRMRTALLGSRQTLVQSNKGCLSIGIEEKVNPFRVSVFPNPSSGVVLVNSRAEFQIDRLSVYSMQGKKMKFSSSGYGNQRTLYLNDFASGIYFLHIEAGKSSQVKRIVLNKK